MHTGPMSQNLEARIPGHQPPLPLVVEPTPTPVIDPESALDDEWRLDEHTRMVGLKGIAAARARLRSSAQSTNMRDPSPGRGRDPDPGRRANGRAA